MINVKELQDKGICPSCYNFEHGGVYEDFAERLIYEDEMLYCFLEENPRAIGHTIILIKEHYNDMSYITDEVCKHIFIIAKKLMNELKDVLNVERVYLCTMCDGAVNHFHIQLIPRYPDEKIGSTNFVKERKKYTHNTDIINKLRQRMNLK